MNTPEDVVRAYFAALSASDVDGVAGLFADDAVVMADGMGTASGSAEIRATYEGAFAQVRIQEEVQVDRAVEAGDVAVVQTHSSGTVTALQGGKPSEVSYRELFVLRLLSDGWRIADYMFNTAGPGSA